MKSSSMKSTAFVFLMILTGSLVNAQTRVVYGTVKLFDTYPVEHVELYSKEAKASAVSDSLGQFYIVCMDRDVIQGKPKAFKPFRQKVNAGTEFVEINLQFIDTKKNREIAVGYGFVTEEALSFAVGHMENRERNFCNYTNILDLLRGELAGVSVSGGNVYIRGGTNSINLSTTALFVVDNVTTNSIDWIKPCQVKSIEVLKDGSASIYGARGGNGVILIELVK
jgi:TonB-dependent SusC/RagA subfamily outer membrane receptor